MKFLKRQKKPVEPVRQPHLSGTDEAYLFRRSRTLTGSLSSSVRAANESSADLQSDRLRHHTLTTRRRKLGGVLLLSLLAVGGISYLLGQYISHVTTVTSVIPLSQRASYEQAVSTYLSEHPTQRFRFSLNQAALLAYVQSKYPEVSTIAVTDGGFFRPSDFTPVLREPVAAWTLGSKTLYIDRQGVAFEVLYTTPPALLVEDRTGINPADAGAVTSERMLRYIGRLVALVQQAGQTVEKIQLPPNTSRQVDLYLSGRGYAFKTSSDRDPAGQAMDVVNAAKYLDAEQITPKYVDVRVAAKAYYQ